MPLRALIQSSPETLSDILIAAEDRYREAEELLLAQQFDGCVYLLGYAAEMWLKAACMRLRGNGPGAPVKPALPPLRVWMQSAAPQVRFSDYHDLSYWCECVAQLRMRQARPLPPALAAELDLRVSNGLHREWIVEMRYRRSGLTAADAWSALMNTWWVRTNWGSLV
jgi:hypothetical protein